MNRAAIAVALLAATLALVGTALAGGQSQYVTLIERLDLTVAGADGVMKGTLASTEARCLGGRKVKFLRQRDGETRKLGGDESSGKGRFKLRLNGLPKEGRYYVRVKRKTSGGDVCLEVTSGKIKVTVNA